LSLALLLLCLRGYEFFLQLLHILCSFDMLSDQHRLMPLIEVLHNCFYPLLFLVPLLDLLILLQLRPPLCLFIEQVGSYADLSLHILYMCCCFLLPLLLHLRGSGRSELFLNVLDILPILIDCLDNLINLLCFRELCCLRALRNFLIGYNQSLLKPICAVFLIFGLEIDLLEHQF
jgi:hypothetical protein